MGKRIRLTFGEIGTDGYCVVEFYGRQYAWFVPDKNKFFDLIDSRKYNCEIIHNYEDRAMIDFTDIETSENIYRQEINPLQYKEANDWVVDK